MKALVLAGGLGTRIRERVGDLPKVMAPVAGRPFMEYVLDRLVAGGLTHIILSVGYRYQSIVDHFGTRYRSAHLRYAVESEPLGTGGAIRYALPKGETEPVLVLNGDTLLGVDFQALSTWYLEQPARLAVVLREVEDVARFGSVNVRGDTVQSFVEKGPRGPGFINAGVYLLYPGIFDAYALPERFSFETDFLQRHCVELQPRAFITHAYFIDIGVPSDYDRAQQELAGRQ